MLEGKLSIPFVPSYDEEEIGEEIPETEETEETEEKDDEDDSDEEIE